MDIAILLQDADRADRLATMVDDAAWIIQDVVEVLHGGWPRLLIVDDSPTGIAAIARVRSDARACRLPIIVLSDDPEAAYPDANACVGTDDASLRSMMRFWTEVSLPPRPA